MPSRLRLGALTAGAAYTLSAAAAQATDLLGQPTPGGFDMLVTGADVIHDFALPAFGLKTDAIPGKVNETWFKADKPGIYYGQCSELCGVDHAFMPIEIDVVDQPKFNAWVLGHGGKLNAKVLGGGGGGGGNATPPTPRTPITPRPTGRAS